MCFRGGGLFMLLPGSLPLTLTLSLFPPHTQWLLYHFIDDLFTGFVLLLLLLLLFGFIFELFTSISLAQKLHVHKYLYILYQSFAFSNTEIRHCILLLSNVLYSNVCHPYGNMAAISVVLLCFMTWTGDGNVKCSKEITHPKLPNFTLQFHILRWSPSATLYLCKLFLIQKIII